MTLRTFLELGRVSNLPTVWTNVLAGMALAGAGAIDLGAAALVAVAMSLAYTGGMFLNDAMDRAWDSRHRPDRPIPAGRASARAVFAWGYGLLGASVVTAAALAWVSPPPIPWAPAASAAATAALIVLYDAWHKANPLAPALMAACRVGVYATAGLAVASPPSAALLAGGAALFAWLVGLTYAARQEQAGQVRRAWPLALLATPLVFAAPATVQHPVAALFALLLAAWASRSLALLLGESRHIGKAVVALIAGISLVDALHAAASGHSTLAIACVAGFAATLALQRWVSGS